VDRTGLDIMNTNWIARIFGLISRRLFWQREFGRLRRQEGTDRSFRTLYLKLDAYADAFGAALLTTDLSVHYISSLMHTQMPALLGQSKPLWYSADTAPHYPLQGLRRTGT